MKRKGIKQDINFVGKPLWFQNPKHDGLGFVWRDRDGYEYRTGYKVPDKVDILILLYLLINSQESDYNPVVQTTRRAILKSCGLPHRDNYYYQRVEDSLKRWKNVAIEFKRFYEKGDYIAIGFGIIDHYKVDKVAKQVHVSLNERWISKIKESQYFKYINFELYKALKRPVSRRLHEILCTKFVERDKWPIGLARLGELLTLSGRKVGDKEFIYASDVLVAIKPAINEINRMTFDPDVIKKTGLSPRDLFTISYELKGKKQERVIIFQCHPAKPKRGGRETEPEVGSLLELANKKSEKLRELVGKYCQKHGDDYVKWNILYANKNSKKNYTAYLQKSLEENWAQEWQEDEQARIQAEKEAEKRIRKELEEKDKSEELQKRVESQRPLFKQAVANLSDEERESLWQKAETMVDDDAIRREFVVKIHYAEFLLEYLNANGKDFLKEVVSDLGFIAEL